MLTEQQKVCQTILEQLAFLKTQDPMHSDLWGSGTETYHTLISLGDKRLQGMVQWRAWIEKDVTKRKVLDDALNNEKTGLKKIYQSDLDLSAKNYVLSQFNEALIGYLKTNVQVSPTLRSAISPARSRIHISSFGLRRNAQNEQ